MGFEVSGSYAVIGMAVLIGFGMLYAAGSNTGEEVTDALEDDQSQSHGISHTDFIVISAEYRVNTLRVELKNTGETVLSVSDTDLLVDGEYVSEADRISTVSGRTNSDLWGPEETLELRVDTAVPSRVKVVTEYGIATTSLVDAFTLTADVAFTNDVSSLKSYSTDNQFTNYLGTATAVGPPVSNFVSENTREVPSINNSEVIVTTATGDRTRLAANGKSGSTRLSAGRWQGSNGSVFYVESGTKDIIRVTSSGTTTAIAANSDIEAQGVAGIGDIDGDGEDELIYGGNSPAGASNSIVYIDENGTVIGTGVGYGTNNGIGLGEPADFNGDGVVRVPYVDGSNNIKLASSDGTTTELSSGTAVKVPLATGNFDGDEPLEIYFAGTGNGELKVLDNATVDNTVRTVTDEQGNPVTVSDDAGVS